LNNYDEGSYAIEYRRLEDQIKVVDGLVIIATDISEDAINISKINAAVAGVEQMIRF